MSQDQQPSSEPAAAPAETAAPSVYTAAEIRSNILAKTGASDMGAFHPAAAKMAAPIEAPGDVEPDAPAAPAAPASQGGDVAAELAAMRAEVAALRKQAEPEPEIEPEQPTAPAHPLEAHARTVLGPGAQPKHLARAVTLLEQAMQWDAFARHHEANPSDASSGQLARAKRARAEIDREIDGLSELAALHAQLADLRAETAKAKAPDPEQQKRERSESLTGQIFTAEAMGKYHPNLWAAMQGVPAMRKLVHEVLMELPFDDSFAARGDAILHALDAECTPVEHSPAPAPAAAPARTPKGPVPVAAPARPPAPQPPAATGEQPFLTRRDFWARVENGFAARGRA